MGLRGVALSPDEEESFELSDGVGEGQPGSQLSKGWTPRKCLEPEGNVLAKKFAENHCVFFLLEHFWLCFCLSPHGIPVRMVWGGAGLRHPS